MDHFKEQANQLMEIRKSGRLPGKKSEGPKRARGQERERLLGINEGDITGVFELPQCAATQKLHGDIVFMDYRNMRLPEKCRREQMEYLKKMAEELMEIRRSSHLPTIEPGDPEDENGDKMAALTMIPLNPTVSE